MTYIEKLQKLQNRAAKLVTNSPFDATALPVIRALQWPTVRELIDFESQKIVFRSLNGDAPSYMNKMFTRVNDSTVRSLRNAEVNLTLPSLKSEGGQKCFLLYIQSKKLQNIILNYITYKILYPTINTIPFGAKNYDYPTAI